MHAHYLGRERSPKLCSKTRMRIHRVWVWEGFYTFFTPCVEFVCVHFCFCVSIQFCGPFHIDKIRYTEHVICIKKADNVVLVGGSVCVWVVDENVHLFSFNHSPNPILFGVFKHIHFSQKQIGCKRTKTHTHTRTEDEDTTNRTKLRNNNNARATQSGRKMLANTKQNGTESKVNREKKVQFGYNERKYFCIKFPRLYHQLVAFYPIFWAKCSFGCHGWVERWESWYRGYK